MLLIKKFTYSSADTNPMRCVICGFQDEKMTPFRASTNFTSSNLLNYGDGICENCRKFFEDQNYRRRSWYCSKGKVVFLDKKDILPTLIDPPDPPFLIHLTKNGKKQGFLQILAKPNFSRDRFVISFDDRMIWIDRKEIIEMKKVAEDARKRGFRKRDLLGDIHPKLWEYRDLCEKVISFKKNPAWEVVVFAI